MARTLTIIVGYPRPALGPNGRGAWQARARLVREAREQAAWAAFEALGLVPLAPPAYATVFTHGSGRGTCFPRGVRVRVGALVRLGEGRKRMDEDGFWGCMKATLDGLTDAGVWRDDKQAVLGTVTYADERIPGEGEVVLTLSGA